MAKIVYVGPNVSVELPGLGIVAVRDEPVEVDADTAKALLEQEVWKRAATGKGKKED